ncbi:MULTISPECIES: ATPase [Ezakiella]|uniref:ATPase n=1 Tax=Ezakiella TaxID=1582879 RepID=UPI00094E865A|nr:MULTISPECIES: ATPase [Ezakiella]
MDVIEIINEIEDVVEGAKTAFLSNKVAVDKEEILELISELRLKLPDEIKQATWIKEERERILNEARLDGEKVINDAKVELSKLLSEDSVMVEAKSQAQKLMTETKDKSKQMTLGSINYSDKLLLETQEELKKVIETLNDNRRQLAQMSNSIKTEE